MGRTKMICQPDLKLSTDFVIQTQTCLYYLKQFHNLIFQTPKMQHAVRKKFKIKNLKIQRKVLQIIKSKQWLCKFGIILMTLIKFVQDVERKDI